MVRDHALWLVSAIAGVLALASVAGMLLKWRVAQGCPHAVIDNLNARIRSWWVMAAALGGALWAGGVATVVLFAIIAVVALREYLAPPYHIRAHAWIAGVLICVGGIAFIPALLTLKIPAYEGHNLFLLVFLVLIAQASDVLQYVWGKLLGRHAIAPVISPSKTVEGLVGGVCCATLIGAGLWWITPFTPLQAAALSLLIALLGFAGGLILSAQKRARGIKDWGDLIRGHGGMLDRLDSLWLPAPLFFFVVKYGWAS
jgi:phosphatidate cytidylyltransferase